MTDQMSDTQLRAQRVDALLRRLSALGGEGKPMEAHEVRFQAAMLPYEGQPLGPVYRLTWERRAFTPDLRGRTCVQVDHIREDIAAPNILLAIQKSREPEFSEIRVAYSGKSVELIEARRLRD